MSLVFCRMTQQGYLRLLTETALMRHYQLPPRTNAEAWATWEVLRDDYRVIFRSEPEGLEERWKRFGARSTASSKLWMDAYLAAFAVTTNSQMVTFDKGFKQFGELNLLLLSA